jgi:hypothetical protein
MDKILYYLTNFVKYYGMPRYLMEGIHWMFQDSRQWS